MAQNKGFADWLASLAAASAQAGDQIPIVQGGASKRVPAGQAGGIARIASDGAVAEKVGYLHRTTKATHQTTESVDDHVIASFTLSRTGTFVVISYGALTRISGTPRIVWGLYKLGTGRISYFQDATIYTTSGTLLSINFVEITQANAGDVIEVHGGIHPNYADGTNEIKIWSHITALLELGVKP